MLYHCRLFNAKSSLYIYWIYGICEHKSTKLNRSKFSYVSQTIQLNTSHVFKYSGARGVMVIVVGNKHGDTSSNPRRD